MPENDQQEYLRIKIFLYKYTPSFTFKKGGNVEFGEIDQYTTVLDKRYFTKYDISDFVSSYSFNQDINENTYSWGLTLRDALINLNDLNTIYKIPTDAEKKKTDGLELSTEEGNDSLQRLSLYETQASNPITRADTVRDAKTKRGESKGEYIVKVDTVSDDETVPTDSLRLSDLIQHYDFVSCFLYKSRVPLESRKGGVVFDPTTNKRQFVQSPTVGKRSLTDFLTDEQILLSPDYDSPKKYKTIFSNEFNGFVITKTESIGIGGVPTLTLHGEGITRLFKATRKILKSSTFQKSIYTKAEIVEELQAAALQNVYADKKIEEIFADLFNLVYRIKFTPGPESKDTPALGDQNFYDQSSLIMGNVFQTNSFTVPPFLLALVMELRGFNFRKPKYEDVLSLISEVRSSAKTKDSIDQKKLDDILNSKTNLQESFLTSKNPIFLSNELSVLRPYFLFIEDVLTYMNPVLNTPFEIIDDIKSRTFLEFIERPNGFILIRPPQYNSTTDGILITNQDVDVISSTYSSTVNNLITRQKIGYAEDAVGDVLDGLEFAYVDGKLLIQYGWLELGADINPNAKNEKVSSKKLATKRSNGLYATSEYLLRLHNAGLQTGTIVSDLDQTIVVGRTYFDVNNNKFGYITNVSKEVAVTGVATMTFGLNYVRDAVEKPLLDENGNPQKDEDGKPKVQLEFEELVRLVDIAQAYTDSILIKETDPEPENQ